MLKKAFRMLINWYFKIWHWSISRKQIKLTASIPHLHDGVGSQDFLFHVGLAGRAADRSKVSHGVFGWYCLSCSGLPAHNDRLVPLIPDKLNKNKKKYKEMHLCTYIAQLWPVESRGTQYWLWLAVGQSFKWHKQHQAYDISSVRRFHQRTFLNACRPSRC